MTSSPQNLCVFAFVVPKSEKSPNSISAFLKFLTFSIGFRKVIVYIFPQCVNIKTKPKHVSVFE